MRLKSKTKGYLAEKFVRDKLDRYFYILPKGISTKGVDIVALNKYMALVIEVKSFNKQLVVKKEQLNKLFEEAEKIKSKIGLNSLKILALIKGKQFKYLCLKDKLEKDIKINEKEFSEMKDFDYLSLLEDFESLRSF